VKTLIAAFALFLSAVSGAAAENPAPLYLVVLEPGGGGPPAEISSGGGTVEYQQGQMLAVRIPETAVDGLRHNPRVRYIQRVASASEEIEAPPSRSAVTMVETSAAPAPLAIASPWTTGTYTYDGSGNIASIGPNSDTRTNVYRYDTIGRLSTATIHTPSTPASGAVAHSEAYQYDRYGNLTQITTDGAALALPADATTNRLAATLGVTYDAVGNLTTDPSGISYSYDAANMLRQRGSTTYLYTAGDERIATVTGTSGARWTLRNLDGKVVREYDSFGPTTGMEYFLWTEDFFHAGSQLVASQRETAEGGRRHYHLDHLGTPLFATNASGNRVSSHAYYPFGVEATSILQERSRGFDRDQPLRYTSHERDGLDSSTTEHNDYIDYMHARYYRAAWGRFLSVDPVWVSAESGNPQSWNRYTYVMNDPLNHTDPSGKCGDVFTCVGLASVGGGAATGATTTATGTAVTASGGTVVLVAAAGAIGYGTGRAIGHLPLGGGETVDTAVQAGFGALISFSEKIRQLGDRAKEGSVGDAIDQLDSIEERQKKIRQGTGSGIIDSTGKSQQRVRDALNRIKDLKDAMEDEEDEIGPDVQEERVPEPEKP